MGLSSIWSQTFEVIVRNSWGLFYLSKKKVSAAIICLKIIWKHDIIFFLYCTLLFRIRHYSAIYDVQTLAMLCCAYGSKNDGQRPQHHVPSTSVTRSSARSPPDLTVNNSNVSVCIRFLNFPIFLLLWQKKLQKNLVILFIV